MLLSATVPKVAPGASVNQVIERSLSHSHVHILILNANGVGCKPCFEKFTSAIFSFFSAEDLSASVTAFDEILAGPFKNFLSLSAKIGGDVATQANMANAAFTAQRQYLVVASKSKKPADSDLPALLK